MGMERVSVAQAAKELNMDTENVRWLMMKGRLPIGYAIKKEKNVRYSYYIYRGMLDTYKAQVEKGELI